jgi:hypothetical protein
MYATLAPNILPLMASSHLGTMYSHAVTSKALRKNHGVLISTVMRIQQCIRCLWTAAIAPGEGALLGPSAHCHGR